MNPLYPNFYLVAAPPPPLFPNPGSYVPFSGGYLGLPFLNAGGSAIPFFSYVANPITVPPLYSDNPHENVGAHILLTPPLPNDPPRLPKEVTVCATCPKKGHRRWYENPQGTGKICSTCHDHFKCLKRAEEIAAGRMTCATCPKTGNRRMYENPQGTGKVCSTCHDRFKRFKKAEELATDGITCATKDCTTLKVAQWYNNPEGGKICYPCYRRTWALKNNEKEALKGTTCAAKDCRTLQPKRWVHNPDGAGKICQACSARMRRLKRKQNPMEGAELLVSLKRKKVTPQAVPALPVE